MDDSTELETSRRRNGQLNDIMAEMRDVKSELMQVGELVGIPRERCAEARTDIAARKLDRLEKEKDDIDDTESEATLEEALTNNTKVVKLVVDKWVIDKGFSFSKALGEIVFIHASVMQGAEVHGRKSSATMLVPRSSTKSLGTKRVETRKGQGGSEPSGAACSGADGRTGSSVREEDRCGVRPATGA